MVQGDFPIKYGPKTPKHPLSMFSKTLGHFKITILKYNGKSIVWFFLNIDRDSSKKNYKRNMDILISNLLSESILDFGKQWNGKYANTRTWTFEV